MSNYDHAQYALEWVLTEPSILQTTNPYFRLCPPVSQYEIEHVMHKAHNLLEAHLKQCKSHFLGSLYEALWLFYLKHSPRYELLAHNQQFHFQGKTLGELDYLVFDKERAQTIHQEIAIKFYLHHKQAQKKDDWRSHWIGPNAIDRLDLKLDKLADHQFKLTEHPVVNEWLLAQGVSSVSQECQIQGRLFYHADDHSSADYRELHPQHLKGVWLYWDEMLERANERTKTHQWVLLEKPLWIIDPAKLALVTGAEQLGFTELQSLVQSDQRARLIAELNENTTPMLLMCVPSGWPAVR